MCVDVSFPLNFIISLQKTPLLEIALYHFLVNSQQTHQKLYVRHFTKGAGGIVFQQGKISACARG